MRSLLLLIICILSEGSTPEGKTLTSGWHQLKPQPKRTRQGNSRSASLNFSHLLRSLNRDLKQQRRQRQRKRHLKITIWEMVTIL